MTDAKSVAYRAGWNDFMAGSPFSTGDELWDVFRKDWRQGWSDAQAFQKGQQPN